MGFPVRWILYRLGVVPVLLAAAESALLNA